MTCAPRPATIDSTDCVTSNSGSASSSLIRHREELDAAETDHGGTALGAVTQGGRHGVLVPKPLLLRTGPPRARRRRRRRVWRKSLRRRGSSSSGCAAMTRTVLTGRLAAAGGDDRVTRPRSPRRVRRTAFRAPVQRRQRTRWLASGAPACPISVTTRLPVPQRRGRPWRRPPTPFQASRRRDDEWGQALQR